MSNCTQCRCRRRFCYGCSSRNCWLNKNGKHVLIGGQAGISGHIKVADETKIVAQSGIPSSIKKAQTLMGSPGIPLDDFKRSYFGFRKLPGLLKKIQELEEKIEALTKV